MSGYDVTGLLFAGEAGSSAQKRPGRPPLFPPELRSSGGSVGDTTGTSPAKSASQRWDLAAYPLNHFKGGKNRMLHDRTASICSSLSSTVSLAFKIISVPGNLLQDKNVTQEMHQWVVC